MLAGNSICKQKIRTMIMNNLCCVGCIETEEPNKTKTSKKKHEVCRLYFLFEHNVYNKGIFPYR